MTTTDPQDRGAPRDHDHDDADVRDDRATDPPTDSGHSDADTQTERNREDESPS